MWEIPAIEDPDLILRKIKTQGNEPDKECDDAQEAKQSIIKIEEQKENQSNET